MINKKYGVVYTPSKLSDFVAFLLKEIVDRDGSIKNIKQVLDPACGEGALLYSLKAEFGNKVHYFGIDVDKTATEKIADDFEVVNEDTIIPNDGKIKSSDYWNDKLGNIQIIIANPPWSSEKIYPKDELRSAGYAFASGQYDSYVLFFEIAYQIIDEDGYIALIIPDSIFDTQNEELRRFLATNTEIKVIARLGEKIFEGVNRAATVIVCKKIVPQESSKTICFRLSTEERKAFLKGDESLISFFNKDKHEIFQSRFLKDKTCNFDIDTRMEEEKLMSKIREIGKSLDSVFEFGRGIEISKKGNYTVCQYCGNAQGYTKSQLKEGKKKCVFCGKQTVVNATTVNTLISDKPNNNSSKIIVGEDLHRYSCKSHSYVTENIKGINYKDGSLYDSPKLLIRKTGLGIYAAIDYSGLKTSQTVYILKYISENVTIPLEYYLALINSRVVYYYYLKVYGENEWKSHPYLTKQIIFSLPIAPYVGDKLDQRIIAKSIELSKSSAYSRANDIQLEKLIFEKYHLNKHDIKQIFNEMNALPDLGAVNNMKIKETDICIDI